MFNINSDCFRIVPIRLNFEDAKDYCDEKGEKLAHPQSILALAEYYKELARPHPGKMHSSQQTFF